MTDVEELQRTVSRLSSEVEALRRQVEVNGQCSGGVFSARGYEAGKVLYQDSEFRTSNLVDIQPFGDSVYAQVRTQTTMITQDRLAQNSVGEPQLQDGSVTTRQLKTGYAAGSVTPNGFIQLVDSATGSTISIPARL